MRLAIKEIVRIIGRQVGTFKSANNYIWAAGRHFKICRYFTTGRQLGTFNNASNPLIFIYFSR